MTQDTENTANIPAIQPLPKRLAAKLEKTLENAYSTMPDNVMVEQAQILDSAFRHLMHRGLLHGHTEIFHAAFKAQNQYRATIKTLESLDIYSRPKTKP